MIIRRRHTANFTTIGNALFDDERLAADELGILAFLRSKPADWEVRRPALMKRFRIGRDAMRRIVSNWMRAGWCDAKKERRPDGTFIIVYEIRDDRGPELSDEEIRRALSPESGEAVTDDRAERPPEICADASQAGELCTEPDTSRPVLVHPSTADPYLVDSNILNTESPRKDSNQIEREYARAKEKHAATLPDFKRRYPTTSSDDQTRIDAAWFELSFEEGASALAGIGPFLEKLKRDSRKHPPSAWKYLEEKRWTLLEAAKPAATTLQKLDKGSDAAKAVEVLYTLAGKASVLTASFMRSSDGGYYYRAEVKPRLLALAAEADQSKWVASTHNQAAAWNGLLKEFVTLEVWTRLREGAPVPGTGGGWPPKVDGTWSETAPDIGCSDQELADFK